MKKLSLTIKSLVIAGLLVAGIGTVMAWNPPIALTVAPNGLGNASINTSAFSQAKNSGLVSENSLIAGQNPGTGFYSLNDGFILAKTLIASSKAVFTHHLLVEGEAKIGSSSGSFSTFPLFANTKPLTIDNTGRSVGDADRVADLITDNSCNNANILVNTGAIQYYSSLTNDNADVLARQVRLSGGNPRAGKILIATNDRGDAVWATPKLQGGQIVFDPSTSPVTADMYPSAACGNPPTSGPVLGCMDPTANNYNAAATQDDGSCTHICPAGQSWDSTQRSCTCNSGIREGMPPASTSVTTTGKIITYLDTVNQNPGGSGAPLVPYYVVLDEVRRSGGPGNSCQIKALDLACPEFDLATVNTQTSFVLNGTTYRTTGGNSWEIDYRVGDQCIMNEGAQAGSGLPLTVMNIER